MPRTIRFSLSGRRALPLSMAFAVSSARASSVSLSRTDGSVPPSTRYEGSTPKTAASAATCPTVGSGIAPVLIPSTSSSVRTPALMRALPFCSCSERLRVAGSERAGGAGMVFMLSAAVDGSGGTSPRSAALPRPLIGLCDPSLCRARTAKGGAAGCCSPGEEEMCEFVSGSTWPRRSTGRPP